MLFHGQPLSLPASLSGLRLCLPTRGALCSLALDLFSSSVITLLFRLTPPPDPLRVSGGLCVVIVTKVTGGLTPVDGTSCMASERAFSRALDMSLEGASRRWGREREREEG